VAWMLSSSIPLRQHKSAIRFSRFID
jgi:hypothetical protein